MLIFFARLGNRVKLRIRKMIPESLLVSNHSFEIFSFLFFISIASPLKSLENTSSKAGVFNFLNFPLFQIPELSFHKSSLQKSLLLCCFGTCNLLKNSIQ